MDDFDVVTLDYSALVGAPVNVSLNDVLSLIEGIEFEQDLRDLFDLDTRSRLTIPIKGFSYLISTILRVESRFEKLDALLHVSQVSFVKTTESKQAVLYFKDVNLSGLSSEFYATTVYSAKREYFDQVYRIEKFADYCNSNGYSALIKHNIDYLNIQFEEEQSNEKIYRLLEDQNGDFFLRTVTSTRYSDYGNRFCVFATLMALSEIAIKSETTLEVNFCEFNESFINLFITDSVVHDLKGIGQLSFSLKMSNDELRREAFNFTGVFRLSLQNKEKPIDIFIQPRPENLKVKVLSIRHTGSPAKVFERLAELPRYMHDLKEEMLDDIKAIFEIKNSDQLRIKLINKVNQLNTELV